MTFSSFAKKKINLSAFLFGLCMIVMLSQLLRVLPHQLYFTFSGFVFSSDSIAWTSHAHTSHISRQSETSDEVDSDEPDDQKQTHWPSIVFKLMVPAVAGMLLGFVWAEDGIDVAWLVGFGG